MFSTTRQYFTLHSHVVRLRASAPKLAEGASQVLDTFGLDRLCATSSPEPTISLTLSARPELPSIPDTAEKRLDFEGHATAWQDGEQLILQSPDGSMAFISPNPSTVEIITTMRTAASADAAAAYLFFPLVSSLAVSLHQQARYLLHAAALADEQRGVLLVADSDCGKSTLTCTLARQGWHFVSDDAVLLHAAESGIQASAFRRTFGLDDTARSFFPELQAHTAMQLTEPNKLCIDATRYWPDQAIPQCHPHVLLFPRIVDAPESCLQPVSSSEAFAQLMEQSGFLMLDPARTPLHLHVLKQLVSQTRHARLNAGRDVLEQPDKFAAWLRSAIADLTLEPGP